MQISILLELFCFVYCDVVRSRFGLEVSARRSVRSIKRTDSTNRGVVFALIGLQSHTAARFGFEIWLND